MASNQGLVRKRSKCRRCVSAREHDIIKQEARSLCGKNKGTPTSGYKKTKQLFKSSMKTRLKKIGHELPKLKNVFFVLCFSTDGKFCFPTPDWLNEFGYYNSYLFYEHFHNRNEQFTAILFNVRSIKIKTLDNEICFDSLCLRLVVKMFIETWLTERNPAPYFEG